MPTFTLGNKIGEISKIYYDGKLVAEIPPDYHIPPMSPEDVYNICVKDQIYASSCYPHPTKVHFNNPATVVLWSDGTKTIVKCQDGDAYDQEKGLAMCYMKKFMGNKGNFNDKMNELINPNFKEDRKEAKKARKRAKKNDSATL